ncbi:aminopeptidase P family protein [Mesorhizobium koreense]|uniref:aminopeptidase P family protein n=1 Tax=Mesorhizobium koreense TaxID=3074855 RepID=UPI00287BAFAF|nr:aminopeptidase P family protein [Mesorhizobium sp. WR6]
MLSTTDIRNRRAAASRLELLRAELLNRKLAGLIIPRFDAHQGEYCAPHDERLAFLTGFTGSAGFAIVTRRDALLFVDGRYQVQAENEKEDGFAIKHLHKEPPEAWLRGNVQQGEIMGFNPTLIPCNLYDRLLSAVNSAGGTLVALDSDPIDAIWQDQPEKPVGRISAYPIALAGETSKEKRRFIGRLVANSGADFLVEAQPDNIAWLLNVRGSDVAFNPVPHSFLILGRSGETEWFVDQRKLPNSLSDYELDDVERRDPARLNLRLAQLANNRTIMIDPDFAPSALSFVVKGNGGQTLSQQSPITQTKAIKNATELEGFRSCHLEDGAALASFLAWLDADVEERALSGSAVRESEAAQKLLEFRQARPGFVEPSFHTISAFGKNAAMCHYKAAPQYDAEITGKGLYLIDSGGQYRSGTTDVTRTIAWGSGGGDVRKIYTAVLKGLISLLTLRFPKGTRGHHIDAFARRALWDLGRDYDHGTGHGVGHFLSVHEHPQRLNQTVNDVDLAAGMVMTIEPGYYEKGSFGIRLENQVEIVEDDDGFLRFESLTLVPIDLKLVETYQLTTAELEFINEYHASVRQRISPLLTREVRKWLEKATHVFWK